MHARSEIDGAPYSASVNQTVDAFLQSRAKVDSVFGSTHYNTDPENPSCQTDGLSAPQLVIIPRYVSENLVRTYRPFAIGRCEVTQREFAIFIDEYKNTFEEPALDCYQGDQLPANCISYEAAKRYTQWLSEKTGHRYRLPTLTEWRLASGAPEESFTDWFSDSSVNNQCLYLNAWDQSPDNIANTRVEIRDGKEVILQNKFRAPNRARCNDGAKKLSPVARYKPNRYGLYDLFGNVAEWVEINVCPTNTDESACPTENVRLVGGNYLSEPAELRGAFIKTPEELRIPDNMSATDGVGFRVVREIDTDIAKTDFVAIINKKWQSDVYAFYEQNLKNTFPFNKSASANATEENVKRLFGSNGLIEYFFRATIETADTSTLSIDEIAEFERVTGRAFATMKKGRELFDILFRRPAYLNYEVSDLDQSIKELRLTVGDCKARYRHGRVRTNECTANKQGFYFINDVRIEYDAPSGSSRYGNKGSQSKTAESYSGPWAFFRLMFKNNPRNHRDRLHLVNDDWAIDIQDIRVNTGTSGYSLLLDPFSLPSQF